MSTMNVLARACIIAFAGVVIGGALSALGKPLVTGELSPPATIRLPPASPTTQPPTTQPPTTPDAAQHPAAPQDPDLITGPEITLTQAKRLFDAGTPFVDARHREEYEAGHVQNAYWMPADLITGGKRPEALDFLAPSQPVVIYCGGGECDASKNVAALLQQGGFTQCLIMTDGFPGWKAANHPVGTGKPDYETTPPEGGH